MKKTLMKLIASVSLLVIYSAIFYGCRKTDHVSNEKNQEAVLLESRFFTVPALINPKVKEIVDRLKRANNQQPFIQRIVKEAGFPVWEKAVYGPLFDYNNEPEPLSANSNEGNDTNFVYIPIVVNGTSEVHAVFVCKLFDDSVQVKYFNEKDYVKAGFNSSSEFNANRLVGLIMQIQNRAYGTTSFVINDGRLFSNNQDSTHKRVVRLVSSQEIAGYNAKNKSDDVTALTNSVPPGSYYCMNVFSPGCGNLGACSYRSCYSASTGLWDGGPPESDLLPSPPGEVQVPGNELDAGGTGGGNYNYGSVSTQTLLQQVLLLNGMEVDFLNNYSQLSEETYNYLNNADGQFTLEERKQMANSHIDYLMESSAYLNYCLQANTLFFTLNGFTVPWFHQAAIGVENAALYSNIQQLKLDAKQAFYLLGSPNLNVKVAAYLSNSNGQTSEEKKSAVTEHINGLLTNPGYATFVQNYEAIDNTGKMWWENDLWLNQNFSFSSNCPLGWCNLTQAERNFILLFPLSAFMIKINSDVAKSETRQMFGIGPNDAMPPNDKSNAFLHAFWCAMNLHSIGEEKARLFATAHESETPQQLQIETTMDFFNNEVGFNIAKTQSTLFSNHVFQALNSGQLRYLKPVNYSDPAFWGANNIPETHGITNLTQIVPTNQ